MTIRRAADTGPLIRLGGDAAAVAAAISPRAASLRALRVHGLDIVEPTTAWRYPPGMSGAVLVPWPNRVDSARWDYGGREQRLAVTEPELGHANHGLLTTHDFQVGEAGADSVVLRALISGHPGYPFELLVTVTYRLGADGIDVATAVDNLGERPAPVAVGAHPYLRVGTVPAERLTVRLDADSAGLPGPTLIPRQRFDVGGTEFDLRAGRPFGRVPRHVTYERAGAPSRHSLTAPDGTTVELHADASHRWLQLYVADAFTADDGTHPAIAVEPMTAPPNALRTGEGLHWLEPDRVWTARWGVRLVA